MGTIVLVTVATSVKVVAYGALLGVGFWVSKKITSKADEYLVMWDKKFLNEAAAAMRVPTGTVGFVPSL